MQCIFHLLHFASAACSCLQMLENHLEYVPREETMQATTDCCHTLHLFEANYIVPLKWHSSLGFMPKSEKANWIHNSQGGSCAGCSAIDLACKQVVLYDYLYTTCTDAIDVSIDVAKCFDNMIDACKNLSCWQHDTDLHYLQLHVAT